MSKASSGIITVLALGALAGASARVSPAQTPLTGPRFQAEMRKLWEDHITWTRLYIVAAAASLPEKDATAERLLRNQTEIGNAIRPFYGPQAGESLTGLLKGHIVIATQIIEAAMKGEKPSQEDAARRWGVNADSIAALLSGANAENWPLAEMKQMLHSHLDLTTEEVVAQLQKDWTGSIAAYDKVREQALKMADQLSTGIMRQFPEKFVKENVVGVK
jgi:hypothetical protein